MSKLVTITKSALPSAAMLAKRSFSGAVNDCQISNGTFLRIVSVASCGARVLPVLPNPPWAAACSRSKRARRDGPAIPNAARLKLLESASVALSHVSITASSTGTCPERTSPSKFSNSCAIWLTTSSPPDAAEPFTLCTRRKTRSINWRPFLPAADLVRPSACVTRNSSRSAKICSTSSSISTRNSR